VSRNKLKRRLREIIRHDLLPLSHGVDIVVRTAPGAYLAGFDALRAEINGVMERLRR
jgi:ribonuclease P protein component